MEILNIIFVHYIIIKVTIVVVFFFFSGFLFFSSVVFSFFSHEIIAEMIVLLAKLFDFIFTWLLLK